MRSNRMLKIAIPVVVVSITWIFLLFSVIRDSREKSQVFRHDVDHIKLSSRFHADDGMAEHFKGLTEHLSDIFTSTRKSHFDLPILPDVSHHVDIQDGEYLSGGGLPIDLESIEGNISNYIKTLHRHLASIRLNNSSALHIWETFLDVTSRVLIPWDDYIMKNYPIPRKDSTIFVSVVAYRDGLCPMTLKSLFSHASNPEKIRVILFQQNCNDNVCMTGILKNRVVRKTSSDIDCFAEFCRSNEGQRSAACINNQIRVFNVNESESLGPNMARYFAAKFYRGEEYYLQIDSHSEFVSGWDSKLINMIRKAPAEKPVISTYPPGPSEAEHWRHSIGYKVCECMFASSQNEWQIIRMKASKPMLKQPDNPVYSPFMAAGFFFASARFLHEVPFDPFLPWIFMGEEISMSARLWTSGYDMFSPTTNVLNHYYGRANSPRFWESVNRFFAPNVEKSKHLLSTSIYEDIVEIVMKRLTHLLGYPESDSSLVPPSVLFKLERWSMGRQRSFNAYMKMVGVDVVNKVVTPMAWCEKDLWPDIALKYKRNKL